MSSFENPPANLSSIEATMWRPARRSERVGAAALLGVYGEEIQNNEAFITRALSGDLSDKEIADVEELRPLGLEYRFGQNGKFGYIA